MDIRTNKLIDTQPHPRPIAGFRDRRISCGEVLHPAGYARGRHVHETLCIQVVLEGLFREDGFANGREFGPGTVLVRPARFEHENPPGDRASSYLCIQVGDEALDSDWGVEASRAEPRAFRAPVLFGIASAAARTLRGSDPLDPALAASLAAEVVGQALVPGPPRGPSRDPRLARKAADVLAAAVGEGITVEELAARLGTDRFHLARCFRAEFGTSVSAHARRLRLEHAVRRIVETREPLAAIAVACGYADQAHMSREVRATCGVPPSRLRG